MRDHAARRRGGRSTSRTSGDRHAVYRFPAGCTIRYTAGDAGTPRPEAFRRRGAGSAAR